MSTATKSGAYSKIDNLVKNIAFPDWITNDTALTAYYSNLNLSDSDDWDKMNREISQFLSWQQFHYLTFSSGSDRVDFNGPPGTTNAWYQVCL